MFLKSVDSTVSCSKNLSGVIPQQCGLFIA